MKLTNATIPSVCVGLCVAYVVRSQDLRDFHPFDVQGTIVVRMRRRKQKLFFICYLLAVESWSTRNDRQWSDPLLYVLSLPSNLLHEVTAINSNFRIYWLYPYIDSTQFFFSIHSTIFYCTTSRHP